MKAQKKIAKQFDDIHFIVPLAKSISFDTFKLTLNIATYLIPFFSGHTIEAAISSDCIAVASGTASLECALVGRPMCIVYQVSLFTSLIAAQFIKVRYLGLCNLLLNRMIVPELIQYDFNAQELTKVLTSLLINERFKEQMIAHLVKLKLTLSSAEADIDMPTLILKMLIK